jgi:serine/threonine protein kinase
MAFPGDSNFAIDEYFIVKEININRLVQKYMKNNKQSFNQDPGTMNYLQYNTNSPCGVNITPYSRQTIEVTSYRSAEEEYYYKRLEQLIDSEVDVLKMLNHDNIIRFYDYSKRAGVYFLHMEYCNGGDVYDHLKNSTTCERNKMNGFSNAFIANFLNQILNGLCYLHDQNIIHRDIKLHNILMKQGARQMYFKLSDFGFSCYDLSEDHADHNESYDVLSKKYFKLCGTPYYMAPEIVCNMNKLENFTYYKNITTRTKYNAFYTKSIDVWSFGICLYELVFNALPFTNVKSIKELEKLYARPDVQELINRKLSNKRINKYVKDVLTMSLQVDYKKRATFHQLKSYVSTRLDKMQTVHGNETLELSNIMSVNENTQDDAMNAHIVRNPIKGSKIEFITQDDSWEKVNKSSSLIMKISVQKGFMEWLMNKKSEK